MKKSNELYIYLNSHAVPQHFISALNIVRMNKYFLLVIFMRVLKGGVRVKNISRSFVYANE